jgi:hypothetical protein
MSSVTPINPRFSFDYDGTHFNVYHANKGEGLPKHDHVYTHCTLCTAGKVKLTKNNKEVLLTKDSQPVVLTAGEWHQLEALEDNTIWTNIFASEFMECDLLERQNIKPNKYLIRFNKYRGQEGRGTIDHVWRVFEEEKEFLCKQVVINVPSHGERTGEDWNMVCHGFMFVDKDTSTIIINKSPYQKT